MGEKIYGKKLLELIPKLDFIREVVFGCGGGGEPVRTVKTKEMCDFIMEIRDTIQEECSEDYRMVFRNKAWEEERKNNIRDLGKHGHAEISQEQTKKAVVLSKGEVTGICKSGTSMGKKLVCQFKNGIDTQLISADEILQWMNSDKYIYGKTWRCWSDTPSLQQEKETPWEALWETDGSTSKPPLGCPPHYTYVSPRIEDLCNAIVRCYADWKPNHNKIALWCKELLYLNEMDRDLRYDEKCKVWREDKNGALKEMP